MTRLPYQSRSFIQALGQSAKYLWPYKAFQEAFQGKDTSRLKQRLNHPNKRDRAFLRLVRQKRARPSRLNQMLTSQQVRKLWIQRILVATAIGLGTSGTVWGALFVQEDVTYWGVPYRVVKTFLNDRPARVAYFSGDKELLHDRLVELDVEEAIKEYYRDRYNIRNEGELDRFIHQIMYNHTRYVGEAYEVDAYNKLQAK